MARTVRETSLETRTARSRLKARRKPYYRTLEPGLHLGYRKPLSDAGKWVARHYIGDQRYEVEVIAVADDYSDADGVAILSFQQAQALARSRMVKRAQAAVGKTGPLTVKDAIDSYIEFLENNRKSGRDAQYAADAFILTELGSVEIDALTTDQIRKWHIGVSKAPARLRTKVGDKQKFKDSANDPESARRRKSTANRILTILKGALNRVWRDGKVASDAAWRRVEPFEGVESARVRYLQMAEATRLLNACDPDFRRLVRGALETGARYGELGALTVSDFNADSGTVTIRQSKANKARHVILTLEGAAFFKTITAGRTGSEFLFLKDDGEMWLPDHQAEPIEAANGRAKMTRRSIFTGCATHGQVMPS